jgi:hypothetical protein
MTEVNEPTSGGSDQCSSECPFCKQKQYLGYKTKHGALKDEGVLRRNLRSSGTITDDVGPIYPLQGAGDRTTGWEAKAGVLEDFSVELAAAPHHIIPGDASMEPSRLETWTCSDKGGKIKEDIGYNIDCAENGIFLPHLPEIYFTRHAPGTKQPMAKYYGQTWRKLSDSAKGSIGDLVMIETMLQMHYTDHSAPYAHVDPDMNYDDECKKECNDLADLMELFADNAQCADSDGKLPPPYELVVRINAASSEVRGRITGFPRNWRSWVSTLAQDLTHKLRQQEAAPRMRFRGLIGKLTD